MRPFEYTALPGRVLFGFRTIDRVAGELERLGCRRALVLSTAQQAGAAESVRNKLGALAVGLHAEAVMHTPAHVSEEAVRVARSLDVDCVVSFGGGSTIGLGKAIALRTDLPQIVIPTTYAGSEATSILGETVDGKKTTQRSFKVLPEVIVYDIELSLTLPRAASAVSGLNAIAHAVEALYAEDANPIVSDLAAKGIRMLARALPHIVRDPKNVEARSDALFGAWACGTCLGSVGMALHHKLCHVLGGQFGLPHAETHAVLLPHVVAYNRSAAGGAMRIISRALGVTDAAHGLHQLAVALDVPLALRDIGMPADGIDAAVDEVILGNYYNPRVVEREELRDMLTDAWQGRPPKVQLKRRKPATL